MYCSASDLRPEEKNCETVAYFHHKNYTLVNAATTVSSILATDLPVTLHTVEIPSGIKYVDQGTYTFFALSNDLDSHVKISFVFF